MVRRAMKNRLPPDVLFLILAPLVAAFIAVVLGSVIYRVTHWDRESVLAGTAGGAAACLVAVRVYLKRRRQHNEAQGAKAHGEPTRLI